MTRRWHLDQYLPGLERAMADAAQRAMATSTVPGLAVALVHHGRAAWAAGGAWPTG